MKKRILSALLCLAMSLTLLPTAAMAAGRFTDVTEKNWFYADVEYAVQQGLVNGTTATTYSPNSNLTYAAAIKLAACMHKKVTQGNTDFTVGSPWYQVYVDYARVNGIIPAGKNYDWNANATRAGYMEIFANAIPDTGLKSGYKALSAINRVDENIIPDVPADHPQAEAIYKLYRAGILEGSDSLHSCNPNDNITRGAVAAILARIMDPSKRISFEMVDTGGMVVTEQPADVNYVAANGKAEFATAVTGGKSPYTYKWFESYDAGATWNPIVNNSTYSGVSSKKLTVKLNSAEAYTGTLYRCQISDAAGHQVVTRSARVTVDNTPLTIDEHPVDATARSGDEVCFNAFAVGGKAPVLYQWQRKASDSDWQDFPPRNSGYETSRSTALILVVSDIDFAAGYSYRCKISDAAGTTLYTNAATLKKAASTLTVTEQPQDVTCEVNDWVDFGVLASGGKGPYTYRWQMKGSTDANWKDLTNSSSFTGTNTAELRVKVTGQDFQYDIQYRCKITDGYGDMVYSNGASAIEAIGTLTITQQPQNETCEVGEQADFAVAVSGGKAPYTYQWQLSSEGSSRWSNLIDNSVIEGAKTDLLMIIVNEQDFEFGYRYRCVITDANGSSVTSNAVTVFDPDSALTITRQPKDVTCSVGEQAVFTVVAAGGKTPYTYQWQWQTRNDDDSKWADLTSGSMTGAKTNELKVDVMQADFTFGYRYRCIITDANGNSVISNTVTVIAP